MAALTFASGKRNQALAAALLAAHPEAIAERDDEGMILRVSAPCLVVPRSMVESSYFAGTPTYTESTDMIMQHIAMKAEGRVLANDHRQIALADDDQDRLMSLRMKAHHHLAVARLSDKLGVSRNDFVLRAIENYAQYLSDAENMEET